MSSTDLDSFVSSKSTCPNSSKISKLPIRKSKLPLDFFHSKKIGSNTSIESISGYSTEENSPRVSTPSFRGVDNRQKKETNCEKYLKFKA
jgi:hypothetical protein